MLFSINLVVSNNLHYEQFQDGTVKCIEAEIPFKIPEGWAWSRLQSICEPITDGTHQTPVYSDSGYIFLSAKNITTGSIDWNNVMHIPESLHKKLYSRIAPRKGDILLAKNGTIGEVAIVDRDCEFDIYVTLALLRTVNHLVSPHYLLRAIGSATLQNFFKDSLIGIGVPNLHLVHIRKALIPIPPVMEQCRIVDIVDKTIYKIRNLDIYNDELQSLVEKARNKILDLAIRGKLVPQDPNDEPASVLLERIRAEKEELIKQGKIKRDKKESIIFKGEDNSYYEKVGDSVTCIGDELPFEIPNNWAWSRLSSFAEIVMGSSPKGEDICSDSSFTEFHQGKIHFSKQYINCSKQYTKKISKLAPKYSVLLCVRAPVGEVNMTNRDICIGRGLSSILPYGDIDSTFLFYWLKTCKNEFINKSIGSTFPAITSNTVKNILLPIPPLNEQNKITIMITNLFNHLESIEASLN